MRPIVIIGLCAGLIAMAGCEKKEAEADPCVAPAQTPPADPSSYAGQRELTHACMKTAAYDIARKGGSIDAVAAAVLAQCAGKEADVIAALRKTGPVYPYQVAEVHDSFAHLAKASAAQARAKGCGVPHPS